MRGLPAIFDGFLVQLRSTFGGSTIPYYLTGTIIGGQAERLLSSSPNFSFQCLIIALKLGRTELDARCECSLNV
eukprot:scaffold25367_cov125-Skeletonema_marinoi.AAC.2